MTGSTPAAEAPLGASKAAITHHYDVPGTAFWQLWLDRSMTYSCGLWADGDNLEEAQARKHDFLIRGAGAAGQRHVLDVGCGWGSAMRRLLDHHDVQRVTGLTLSETQAEYVNSMHDARCEVRVESFHDHQPAGPYDAILSMGAMEHFARLGLDREEKVAAYRDFFSACHRMLEPGSRLALQTIVEGNVRLDRQGIKDARFIYENLFPETVMPRLAEVIHASEKLFDLVEMRIDGEHYVPTLSAWLARLNANRELAVQAGGEEVAERYARYLAVCQRQFEKGHTTLVRMIMTRV